MPISIRRTFAAGAITAIGCLAIAAPANADEPSLECDPAVVAAAVDSAQTDARLAQKAFTSFTKGSVTAEAKRFKSAEVREAKAADKKADRLADKAERADKATRVTTRAAAKAARAVARAEAKEAKTVQRASRGELRKLAKAEKRVLKAEWETAKDDLAALRKQAEQCEQAPVEEPVIGEPVADQPPAAIA